MHRERLRARQHAIKTGHKCPSALSSSVSRLGTTRDVRTGHDCLAVPGGEEANLSPTAARSFLLVSAGLPPTPTCATLLRSGL